MGRRRELLTQMFGPTVCCKGVFGDGQVVLRQCIRPRIDGNPDVFPGTKERAHLVGLQKIRHQLCSQADLPDVRLHDLRHSFASVGAASGDSLLIIGKLLGHKSARLDAEIRAPRRRPAALRRRPDFATDSRRYE